MTVQTKAAELPAGSVVVDDLKGTAFYAVGEPGEEHRWSEALTERADSTIDYALRRGAQVVRVGDEQPGELEHLRVEVAELRAVLQGPVDDIPDDGRDRLARWLFLRDSLNTAGQAEHWDSGRVSDRLRRHYETQADAALAAITGQETSR